MPERLLTTDEAAAELGVPAAAIRKWKTRLKVVPAAVTRGRGPHRGSPLYRLEELRPLAEAYHRRATTRRASH